jgi:hypothetical protein
MTEPRNPWPRDLQALRYLDALNAQDLEAVAALWEQASHDPELERLLAELDGALFVEVRSQQGPLPAALGRRGGRWAVWGGLVGAAAAACWLAVLAWPGRNVEDPIPIPPRSTSVRPVPVRPPDASAGLTAWREARLVLEGAEPPAFTGALQEMSPLRASRSMPSDLLD